MTDQLTGFMSVGETVKISSNVVQKVRRDRIYDDLTKFIESALKTIHFLHKSIIKNIKCLLSVVKLYFILPNVESS